MVGPDSRTLGRDTLASTRPSRRVNLIAVQTFIGVFFFGVWIIVAVLVLDEDATSAIVTRIPYLVVYELGILSRYIPGMKSFAKRLD
jgi:hypothetical protein